jgi:DNA helicase IV
VTHPDLPAEQAYLDRAHDCLERMRETSIRAADAAATAEAALYVEAWTTRRLRIYEDARRGLCFGRIDLDGTDRPVYVGRRWVHDDDDEAVVVNWQAPAARPFYTATPADPQRLTRRRRFRIEGRRLLDIADETLDGSTASVAGGDFLLEDLERMRDPHMRDIVATIQADQYRLITREPEPPLVVQGGPGTGKTAVGLHRASWLLYSHRERFGRRGVLVVGPNRTFMEYVAHVLPALGEQSVEQRAIGDLLEGVAAGRPEAGDVAALKGDARMADVVRRAIELLPPGEPEDLFAFIEGDYVRVRADEVAALLDAARAELGRTAAARERFRMDVLRAFYADYGRKLGGAAVLSFEQLERSLRSAGLLQRVLQRAWPAVAPDAVVRRLLTSPSRLAEAAEGILDRREQRLLHRDRPRRASELVWSEHDLPLLDEAAELLAGPPRRFGHVIVDEAQDLTPMQLRMISRRAEPGSLTLLGDLAQATGPVTYERWEEVARRLPAGDEAVVEELRHAYRVPAEIMALALPLLERVAPGYEPPAAFRSGGSPPRIRRVAPEAVLREAFAEASALASGEGLLAVIAPEALVARAPQLSGSAFDESIPVLAPRSAKGLEFDHVVVVEPAAIAEGPAGLRELYVALTRPTRTLVVVHARELPRELGAEAR